MFHFPLGPAAGSNWRAAQELRWVGTENFAIGQAAANLAVTGLAAIGQLQTEAAKVPTPLAQ
jgi:hypothetical protein